MKKNIGENHYFNVSKKEPHLFPIEIYNTPEDNGIKGEIIVFSPKKEQLLYICKYNELDEKGSPSKGIETMINTNLLNEYSAKIVLSDLYKAVTSEIEKVREKGEPLSKLTFLKDIKSLSGSLEKTIKSFLRKEE